MMMTCSKNSSNLHFVHRICKVTSFYHDEILMFTRNPSQDIDFDLTNMANILDIPSLRTTVPLTDVDPYELKYLLPDWLPLENVKSGQINLRCTWFTLTAKPEDLPLPD
nr:uncharacterized protein LOC131782964 [Pocillopora verrucosa]XP_058955683.1 uncharacterized protein LOC131782964 [Pocillopora verrucosa]